MIRGGPLHARSVPPDDRGHVARMAHGSISEQIPNEKLSAEGGHPGGFSTRHVTQEAQQAAQVYTAVLGSLGMDAADVFPANKIATRCHDCAAIVSRDTGYKHHNIGKHYTLCARCQAARGYPVRVQRAGARDGRGGAGEGL